MIESNVELVRELAIKSIRLAGERSSEIERFCWMVVHEYKHGVMPVEYDIRDIDEELYLSVLNMARKQI